MCPFRRRRGLPLCRLSLQRSPSGFNLQPYVCVLVRDRASRERLSAAMLHSNVGKVLDAPAVVVFAADLGATACAPCLGLLLLVLCVLRVRPRAPRFSAAPRDVGSRTTTTTTTCWVHARGCEGERGEGIACPI